MAKTKNVPETMDAREVAKFFGKETLADVNIPADGKAPTQKWDAKDFKAALLTDERVVVYMTAEKRTGAKTDYYVFRNPLGQRALVFPADSVLEVDIEGLVDQETIDRAASMNG